METVIHIDEVTDPIETIKIVRKEIGNKDIEGSFNNIRYLKSGAIVVESNNGKQQEKLKLALENKRNIQIKENQSTSPMFIITGIMKGWEEEEFIRELVRLNNEIEKDLQYNVTDKIKVVTRKPCRNQAKENWILQAPAEISKWFLKKQMVLFDLLKRHVHEHINMAVCFQCSGFGHVAKYCRDPVCCHKCGEEHQGKECQKNYLKCPNCVKMRYKPEECQHSARDINCPVYRRRVQQYRSQIDYSGSFL